MELITILNRCHRFRGFVYHRARFTPDHKSIEVSVRPRQGSAAVCSRCRQPPLSLDDARRLVQGYVERYNNVRLNSATGYITPKDMLAGRQQEIQAQRDLKLEAARKQRQIRRKQAA